MGGRKRRTGGRRPAVPADQLVPAVGRAASPATQQLLTSASGYQVQSVGGGAEELVTVTAPDGRLCLSIALRPQGPVVEVHAESLRFASRGLLRLDCDRLEINAASETTLRTGALVQEVAGEVRTRAGGTIDMEAYAHRIRSVRGDIALHANDDVSLDGERVLLNSPRPAISVAPGQPAPAPAPAPTPALASRASRKVAPLFGLPGAPSRRR